MSPTSARTVRHSPASRLGGVDRVVAVPIRAETRLDPPAGTEVVEQRLPGILREDAVRSPELVAPQGRPLLVPEPAGGVLGLAVCEERLVVPTEADLPGEQTQEAAVSIDRHSEVLMPDESRPSAPSTLYDRLGGEAVLESVVYDFYKRVFADALLATFFEGIEPERLQRMQREFFAAALDGPVGYSGRPLNEVHAGLGIQARHLARFLEHLLATLSDRDLSEHDRYDIYSRVNTYANDITGSTTVDG